jgi:hypothetical protein
LATQRRIIAAAVALQRTGPHSRIFVAGEIGGESAESDRRIKKAGTVAKKREATVSCVLNTVRVVYECIRTGGGVVVSVNIAIKRSKTNRRIVAAGVGAKSAAKPIAVLSLLRVLLWSALAPLAVVLLTSARNPLAVLLPPVLLKVSASTPVAVFWCRRYCY